MTLRTERIAPAFAYQETSDIHALTIASTSRRATGS